MMISYVVNNYKNKKPGDDLLSHGNRSTIGAIELDFCVRYGNRYILDAIITRQIN
jgi:hypothetical protein